MIQSETLEADSPEFRAVVSDVQGRLGDVDNVKNVVGPYGNVNAVSPDGHSVLVDYEVPGDADETSDRIDAPVAAIDEAAQAHPEFFIDAFGSASIEKEFDEEVLQKDFQKAEVTSLPLTLVILLVTFGTLLAAGIPLLLARERRRRHVGPHRPHQPDLPVEESIKHVVLLIGLAVGVDYSLFYMRREGGARSRTRATRRWKPRPRPPGARCSCRADGDDRHGRHVPRGTRSSPRSPPVRSSSSRSPCSGR